jgi:integrase
VYGGHLTQFIALKQKLGFRFKTGAVILSQLDRLAAKRKETATGITEALAQEWGQKRAHESAQYHHERIRQLLGFSVYLRDLNIASYLPRLPRPAASTFIPYIYSQAELQALFTACDGLRLDAFSSGSSLISMPALLRLLYGTGLRISEALALQNKDVNLEQHYVRVKDAKNKQQRLLPLSESLVAVLKQYVHYRDELPLEKRSEYFFVKLNGQPCGGCSVRSWFRKCLSSAGIACRGDKQGPRIHDLRHTFAVTALARMAEAGVDLYVSLPVLSRYLGHQTLESTNHYVRLTANMYPDLIRQADTLCMDVFPKPYCYEAH